MGGSVLASVKSVVIKFVVSPEVGDWGEITVDEMSVAGSEFGDCEEEPVNEMSVTGSKVGDWTAVSVRKGYEWNKK